MMAEGMVPRIILSVSVQRFVAEVSSNHPLCAVVVEAIGVAAPRMPVMRDRLRFLTKQQVRDKTTLSPAEIDRREQRHEFPKRHRLSAYPRGRVVWWEHEIDEWMLSQLGGDISREVASTDRNSEL